jgi:hypothetical protein
MVRVLVEVALPSRHVAEGDLRSAAAVALQRRRADDRRTQVLAGLPPASHRVLHRYRTVPYLALEVTPAALDAMRGMGHAITRVLEDGILHPVLAESAPLVQSDQAWSVGFDGAHSAIAVLDTGLDASHPMLSGRILAEACFSSTVVDKSQSFCPSGADEQIGEGAAAPCSVADCLHGTHVAGIAAGSGATAGTSFSGVAPGASIVPVQVFSRVIDAASCATGVAPCAGAFTSDVLAGLEYVYTIATTYNIVAVNMSLGGNLYMAACDSEPYKEFIDNLRSIGVASVVASGNSGSPWAISTPACVSSAISVGSTTKTDAVSWFSNVASFLSLFAPGESITSSVPGGSYAAFSGTSMAAPHVAGAWAILRQAAPEASVDTVFNALRQTGLPITDTRLFGSTTVPRIQVLQALATLTPITNPSPEIVAITPSRLPAGRAFVLTVAGHNFNAFSAVRWNGAARPTTVLSMTRLTAQIPASDVPAAGRAQIDVFTPAPGGGTSAPLSFTIDPPPSLALSASLVPPGSPVTVTLTNGYGGASDWIGFFATTASDTGYLRWTNLGGATESTWTITAPTANGTYEFRLLANNVSVAKSSPVTVDSSVNPVPSVTSLVPSATVVSTPGLTLKVRGNGFANSSIVRWNGSSRQTTFVSATELRTTITADDLAVEGSAQVTVATPAPGGGVSGAVVFAIRPPPSLAVSATTVTPGGSVTVTLTNGFGGSTDWIALAATNAPSTSYIQWVYVGTGLTARNWTVTMPTTLGTYEFRFFPGGGYTRAATSPAVMVTVGSTPGESPQLSVSAATVAAGASITVTLTNGYGGSGDWLAFAATAAANSTYLQSTKVGAGVTTRTWTVPAPSPPGTYEFRLFLNGGYTRTATSPTVTVTGPATPPSLTISANQVAPGGSVTVTLRDGYGGSGDWMSLAAAGASSLSYIKYTYVGAGLTTRTWTVTMPASAGTYEFRLYLNNTYTIAARSAPVIVAP